MAIAEVTGQRCSTGTAGATTVTLTYPGTPTEGNLLVAAISWRINTTISAVPSGWALATNGGNGSGLDSAIYYKLAGAAEPTAHQWTFAASAKAAAVAGEWSGIASASPLDKSVVGGTNSTATVNAGNTGTLSQADELIVCLYSAVDIEAWTALSDSQTQIGNVSSTGGSTGSRSTTRMAGKIVSATTAANFTSTLEFSQLNSGAVATFKAGGAATHAATGALPGLSASVTGTSQHKARHTTTGALPGLSASVTGTSQHKALHATSSVLAGQGSSVIGASMRYRQHTTSGILPGLSASLSGSSARFLGHLTSGILAGQGSAVVGASSRYKLHATTGVLPGQSAAVSGSSQHKALHTTSGALAGQSASIVGSSVRFRSHATTGALPGLSASIAGEAAAPGALTHETSGALTGQSSSVVGSSAHVVTYPVRYIRDALNGSSGNAASYWVEIQAYDGAGTNIASGKTVTANFTPSEGALTQITNADTNTNNYVSSASANSRVTVDLGATYNIASVTRYHYNGDGRTFYGTKTETSVDGITWSVIFSSVVSGTYAEQTGGKNNVTIAQPAVNEQQLGTIVPAYTVDAGDWADHTRTASIPGSHAIINPSSGPGTVTNSTIAGYVTSYRAAGGKILGYISSSYAGTVNTARTAAAVKADVDTYISLYSIDGFFIDEMTATDSGGNVAYYTDVYTYIKSLGSYTVVGNAGAALVQVYASTPVADIFIIFEGTAASIANFAMPVWTDNYAATKFAWMAHTTSTIGAATDIITTARNENTYYVFVTDDILSNPYDIAPSYWADFAADLAVNSGYLVGQGSVLSGASAHIAKHATSGTLSGQSSVVDGSATRSTGSVTHTTTSVLAGQGSIIAGSSARYRQHATTSALTGQGTIIDGLAARSAATIGGRHVLVPALSGIGHEINGVLASLDALAVYRQPFAAGGSLLSAEAGTPSADTGYPVIESVTETTFAVDATAHAVSMPATVNVGDGLIVILTTDGSATVTTPNGWKQLYTEANGTALRGSAYAKVGRGTEGGTTVDFVTSATENAAAQVYRITNWNGTLAGIQAGTVGEITTGTTADPASVTAYWGSAKTIWLATCHTSTSQTISSGPTSYTNLTQTSSAAATTGAQCISARRSREIATEDPDVFTTSGTGASKVYNTIAIAPAYVGADYEHFEITQGTTLWAGAYTSQPLTVADAGITRAVIVLHGSGLDAAEYQNVVQHNLVDYLGKVIVITPFFAESTSDPETNQLFWGTSWPALGLSDVSLAWRMSSGGVLDELIADLYATFANLEGVILAGHSAGGQLCNRYSAASPDALNRYLVSAPSSYVYPGVERSDGLGGWSIPGSPSTYDDYKYGLDALSSISYVNAIGAATLRTRLAAAKVHYMCGALDNDPADTSMDLTADAAVQGSHRVERQQLYHGFLIYWDTTATAAGTLTGQSSILSASANRYKSYTTTGVLPGGIGAIVGSSTRYRQHETSGVLPGQTASVAGSASRFAGAVTHSTSGVLTGQGSGVAGTSAHRLLHSTNGTLTGSGSSVSGVALRFRAFLSSGALISQGAGFVGSSNRFIQHSTSGLLTGQIGGIVGAALAVEALALPSSAEIVVSLADTNITASYLISNIIIDLASTNIEVSG